MHSTCVKTLAMSENTHTKRICSQPLSAVTTVTGPAVQYADIPPLQSATTLDLHTVARKLLLISHPAEASSLSWLEYTVICTAL